MENTVILFGLGDVGMRALELLARSEGVDRIVAADINKKYVYRMNGPATASIHQGFYKKFEFYANDVKDVDATARLLDGVRPAVILSVTSTLSPRLSRDPNLFRYPEPVRERLTAVGFGVELPFHLLLPYRLMQAVNKSGIETHVVNGSFPDVVGPALWKHLGYGPTVGLGNHDHSVVRITKYLSMTREVPAHDVTLYFVGSHALVERGGLGERDVPFFLKIVLGDRDVTNEYDAKWLIHDCMPVSASSLGASTASSGVRNVMAILRDTHEYLHAPSPNGLIGGYPVRLSAKGAEVVLPRELTLDKAIKINEEAEKYDGIEKIKDDGTVVYTDKAYSIMKELGYDCKELRFDELESRGQELLRLYRKLSV